jgi:hypothetical protein
MRTTHGFTARPTSNGLTPEGTGFEPSVPLLQKVQALEDELNNRLFHKSNSGYGLTDAGERLLAGAEAIENEAKRSYGLDSMPPGDEVRFALTHRWRGRDSNPRSPEGIGGRSRQAST